MLERFELEGKTYYQAYRRCGKDNCKTCREGRGHGPYWYARDQATGKRTYHGRELPLEILHARDQHRRLFGKMIKARRAALRQFEALSNLINTRSLDAEERHLLEALGFGACLVYGDGHGRAQDALQDLPPDQLLRALGYEGLPGMEEPETEIN